MIEKNKIIAIVATCNREELLINRSILSIIKQKMLPDCILIVNDSEQKITKSTIESLQLLSENKVNLIFLENIRTKGASGAWNTGIIYAGSHFDINNSFVSILDDDDEWDENHLKLCSKYMKHSDMIISGIKRIEDNKTILYPLPQTLDESALLIGNTGIQGSNIFINLNTMYEVGMFDENLLSSTDRDLCIRLSEIGTTAISTNTHSVLHYADKDRIRLSTPSAKKSKELSVFWNKYNGRMTENENNMFLQRADKLFNFTPIKNFISKENIQLKKNDCEPFKLVVGIISDSPDQVKPLLIDLKRISSINCLSTLEVIVMQNGGDEDKLKDLVLSMRNEKLNCLLIDKKQRINDFENMHNWNKSDVYEERLPIGKARSVLQKYIGTYTENIENCFVWLLDDDMRLESKVETYLTWLPKFKEEGVDILLGCYEGGSPNPSTNAIRVQLHDLLHNLKWLENLNSDDILPDKEDDNNALRLKYPDYYYDLSRKHFGHLESPFWITKIRDDETVNEVKQRIYSSVNMILTGEPLFRPLKVNLPTNPILDAKDSSNRGGTTFILDTKLLKKTPNAIIEIKGKESRRSDMIWSIINKFYHGYNIKFVNFSIYHDRNRDLVAGIDFNKTLGEIRGSAIYAGLSEALSLIGKSNFDFTDIEITQIINKVFHYMENRLELYKQNFVRIRGLVKALRKYDNTGLLNEFLNYINNWFSDDNLDRFKEIALEMNVEALEKFFRSLKGQINDYSKKEVCISFLKKQNLSNL